MHSDQRWICGELSQRFNPLTFTPVSFGGGGSGYEILGCRQGVVTFSIVVFPKNRPLEDVLRESCGRIEHILWQRSLPVEAKA